MDDDIDFANIPSHPKLLQQQQQQHQHKELETKRGTINIFKRVVGDPFEDFESAIKETEPLSTITFRSPIEDLDENARSRISIASLSSSTTTTSKSSSDYSELYMEPPPARPLPVELTVGGGRWRHSGGATIPHSAFSSNTVPSKPKRSPNIVLPRLSSLEEGEVLSSSPSKGSQKRLVQKTPSLPPSSDCYEPISAYTSAPGLPTPYIDTGKKFHTISSASTKHATRRKGDNIINNLSNNSVECNLPINSNFSSSKRATVPTFDRIPTGNVQSSLNNHHTSLNDHHHRQSGEPKKVFRKFDPTAYDISDVHKIESQEKSRSPSRTSGLAGGVVGKRRSLGTPPTSSQDFSQNDSPTNDRSSVILRRHSSGRSTCSSVGSNSTGGSSKRGSYKTKKSHEYDEVAIEDGNVVFITPHDSSDSSATLNNNSCSSLTSRNSVVQEFDPLFDARTGKNLGTGFPPTATPLDLNDTQQHRYEYIDTDGDENHDNSCDGSSTEENNMPPGMGNLCLDNPGYSPSTPRSSREIKVIDEEYEPVASPKDGISPKLSPKPRMGTRVLRKGEEFTKHAVLPPTPSPPVIPEETDGKEKPRASLAESTTSSTGVGTGLVVAPPTTSPPSSGTQSLFRKFSTKFRLNAIREEKDDKRSSDTLLGVEDGYASLTTICKKCSEPHPESTKCKFAPNFRHDVQFAGDLFRTAGFSRKEFAKKRGVLTKAKLTFYNDKQEAISEVSLERFAVVSKRNDYKLAQSQSDLKCFELGLGGGKTTSYVFASASEEERCTWMQKLLEAYTSAFPASVLKNFDRGGWCFIKVN